MIMISQRFKALGVAALLCCASNISFAAEYTLSIDYRAMDKIGPCCQRFHQAFSRQEILTSLQVQNLAILDLR